MALRYVTQNGVKRLVILNTKDIVCYATSISFQIGLLQEIIKPRKGLSWNMSYNNFHLKSTVGLRTNVFMTDVLGSAQICSWT